MTKLAPTTKALPVAARLDEDTRAAIGQLLAEGESANTRASYQSAIRYWLAWWELRFARPAGLDRPFDPELDLPLPPEVIVTFIADHVQRLDGEQRELRHELPPEIDRALVAAGVKARRGAMALNTLQHRLAAMARLHTSRKLASPSDNEDVRRLMRAVRSAYARRGQRARPKDALAAEQLRRLLATCDASPQGVRDRALLLFGFASGGRRRSEIAEADLALLRPDAHGFTYNLAFSKTNQAGEDRPENHKPIRGEAAQALRAWLALLAAAGGIKDGPIFRRVRRSTIGPEPLSDHAVWDIVRRRCKLAGLSSEGMFSAHSLRSGFMTEAAMQKVPLDEMMAFSGHRDVKTAMGYIRKADMKNSSAATLLDSALED